MKALVLLIVLCVINSTYADNNLGIEKDVSKIKEIQSESLYCEIPHVRQCHNLCVTASAEMVLGYYGQTMDQKDIKRLAVGKNLKDSDNNLYTTTLFVELVRGLKKKGVNWQTKTYEMVNFNEGLRFIIGQLKDKKPVLVDTTLYGGHTVVVSGYNEKTKSIIITDPNIDAPGIRILTEQELKKVWNSKGACRALVVTEK